MLTTVEEETCHSYIITHVSHEVSDHLSAPIHFHMYINSYLAYFLEALLNPLHEKCPYKSSKDTASLFGNHCLIDYLKQHYLKMTYSLFSYKNIIANGVCSSKLPFKF